MTPAVVLAALDLPPETTVRQRVPKKLLIDNGAPTTADKRQIADGVESLYWEASLKPITIGVPAYRDTIREYLEIAVLTLSLRPQAKSSRLQALVHRAIPYPLLLLTTSAENITLSLAHKRWSQGEAGKTVLESDPVSVTLPGQTAALDMQFLQALALARQPRASMQTLYQGWIDTCHARLAAQVTGTFTPADSAERAAERRQALQACADLEAQIERLRHAAVKEKQLARRVELNNEINQLRNALADARVAL